MNTSEINLIVRLSLWKETTDILVFDSSLEWWCEVGANSKRRPYEDLLILSSLFAFSEGSILVSSKEI